MTRRNGNISEWVQSACVRKCIVTAAHTMGCVTWLPATFWHCTNKTVYCHYRIAHLIQPTTLSNTVQNTLYVVICSPVSKVEKTWEGTELFESKEITGKISVATWRSFSFVSFALHIGRLKMFLGSVTYSVEATLIRTPVYRAVIRTFDSAPFPVLDENQNYNVCSSEKTHWQVALFNIDGYGWWCIDWF